MNPPTFLEKARKFIVAAVGIAIVVGGPYLDILESSDLTSTDGIIKAVLAVLTAAGVYGVANRTE